MTNKDKKKQSVTNILSELQKLVHNSIDGDIVNDKFTAFELILLSLDAIKEEYEKPSNVISFKGSV